MKSALLLLCAMMLPPGWDVHCKPDGSAQFSGNDGRRVSYDSDTGQPHGDQPSASWHAEVRINERGHAEYFNDDAIDSSGRYQEQQVDLATWRESLQFHTGVKFR
jgi:hypothetical protein